MTEYFATAPTDEFFWWILGGGIVAAAGFLGSFLFLHRCRLVENMPTSRLRSAAQGYVELEGRARVAEGPPIIAPLTKQYCCWWRYRVERKERAGRNTRWVTVHSGLSDDSFVLDDGTGTCMVDPDHATVIPSHHHVWYGTGSRPDISPEMGRGWWRAAFMEYRYVEDRIDRGDPVYALGAFRTQAGGPETFDEQLDLKDLLAKWKHDRRMMALLDTNKDGTVDAKEWEAARRMAQRKVRDESVQRAVESADLNVLARPRDGRPYILSGVPQARLVRRYRLQSVACIALATVAAFVLLEALMARGIVG